MPVSFFVLVAVVALFVIIPTTLKLAGVVLGRRRQLCPGCSSKALAMTGGTIASRSTPSDQASTWAEYECEHCHAQYVKQIGTGLMPRQAWLAGAQEAIPTAIVIERDKP